MVLNAGRPWPGAAGRLILEAAKPRHHLFAHSHDLPCGCAFRNSVRPGCFTAKSSATASLSVTMAGACRPSCFSALVIVDIHQPSTAFGTIFDGRAPSRAADFSIAHPDNDS
jgi:hypothetical protein